VSSQRSAQRSGVVSTTRWDPLSPTYKYTVLTSWENRKSTREMVLAG
jgi:hypothetical protein